jgi:hypothetical protein
VAYLADDRRGIRAIGLEVADDAAVREIEKRVVSDGFKVLGDTQLIGSGGGAASTPAIPNSPCGDGMPMDA